MGIETNIFPIENLADLSSIYRLYRIRGLAKEHPQYFQNLQTITRKLSYELKSPVSVIELSEQPHLVLRDDAPEPDSPYPLVRAVVYFDRVPGTKELNFTVRDTQNDTICLRFLQFTIQAPLSSDNRLWQPSSGKPFFQKLPAEEMAGLVRYLGFSVRAVVAPGGRLGLCVDLSNKIVSATALPLHVNPSDFRKWRGLHCVYHFGHKWYEVQLRELGDLNVTEYLVPLNGNGNRVSLLEYIATESRKPLPKEVATLPHDSSVILYPTNMDELRGAPSGLCYPIFGTDEQRARAFQASTTIQPAERRRMIREFVSQYLHSLRFGNVSLQISEMPVEVPQRMFVIPDYQFGRSHILSVRGTKSAQHVSLDQVGRTRAALLRDKHAGFYITDRLERQYLVLPQTVADSYGPQFHKDLKATVEELFPSGGYDPILVTYNDRIPRTFVDQGRAIHSAVQQQCTKHGYALVMIHHTNDRLLRQHDQLAAMVVRELRKLDICAAVNHSAVGQECYELVSGQRGDPFYRVREAKKGKFRGYLRNVALNKVLLTNERWPFVLASPLHADLTIGIDVKEHTAGFTVVGRHGSQIRTICRESKQKEQLHPDQVKKYLVELVRQERQESQKPIDTLVVHRDGRLWENERVGFASAFEVLRAEGAFSSAIRYAILEIPKKSQARVRLFDVTDAGNERSWVENPQVGCFFLNQDDAYLCATGRAFPRRGTVHPLHVRFMDGNMPFEDCLEDLYCLTTLTWTRPEDCTRYPITIKLNDQRLGEDASDYDMDALEFRESESVEELS
jgi:hypothetical protein